MYRNQTSGSFSHYMFGKCQNQKQGCFRDLLCQRLLTGQDNLKKYIFTYLKTQKSLIQQAECSGMVFCSVCVNPELIPLTVKWYKASIKMAQQRLWESSGWSHPEGRNNDGSSQQQAAEQPGRSRLDTAAAHPPAGCHLIRAALVLDSSCPCLRTLRGTQSWWLGCKRWVSERHQGLHGSEMHQRGSQLLVVERKGFLEANLDLSCSWGVNYCNVDILQYLIWYNIFWGEKMHFISQVFC